MTQVPVKDMVLSYNGKWLGSEEVVSQEFTMTMSDLLKQNQGASGTYDQQLRNLPAQNDELTMADCKMVSGAMLQLHVRPKAKGHYVAENTQTKQQTKNNNTSRNCLGAFVVVAVGATLLMPYASALVKPDNVLPLKVSIPLTLLAAALAAVATYACQGQER